MQRLRTPAIVSETMRYLTEQEKRRELAFWESVKLGPRPQVADLGGYGYPDPEMFAWCDRINALRGVCTLQSCAGHRHPEFVHVGELWLWFDQPTLEAFWRDEAMSLAASPLIERVHRMAQGYGHEVVDIQFHGDERGTLEASMSLVCAALERTVLKMLT